MLEILYLRTDYFLLEILIHYNYQQNFVIIVFFF